jgi:A/G-specific adenine glycosylase
LGYYERFIARFPDVRSLAEAGEEEVLKVWQGLGYYTRARNMHQAARQVMNQHMGIFPADYHQILALQGVGVYSASAVASFAFGLPYPVMDGNVIRVISRVHAITDPVTSAFARNRIKEILEKEIDRHRPGLFNQAIMEFGALQCVPKNPACSSCPLEASCVAWNTGSVHKIPMKDKKSPASNRFFHYLVFMFKEEGRFYTLLKKREAEDIWKNLYQFPLVESERMLNWKELKRLPDWGDTLAYINGRLVTESDVFSHLLSHQRLIVKYFIVSCDFPPEGLVKVSPDDMSQYPVPRLVEKVIKYVNITFSELND